MVYRLSWLAGAASLGFAISGLSGLLRPTSTGTKWQFIVVAALVLGVTITWTALSYGAHPILVAGLNVTALVIAIPRVAAPETITMLLPSAETFIVLRDHLDGAFALIRTGVEPVQPLPGIVVIVAAVFLVAGALMTWGLMRGHPYVALVPPLVIALQFATMDRDRTGWLRIGIFLGIVAGSVLAINIDERTGAAGQMAALGRRVSVAQRFMPSTMGLLGVTLTLSVAATGAIASLVPSDGVLPWRSATGLTSDFYGGITYNPFVGIRQSLVSQSDAPVFVAEIIGDVPASEVYFRLVTMETYNGGQFFADKPTVADLEVRPWEDVGHSFAGPTSRVTTTIQIERLRMDWLPAPYAPDSLSSENETMRDARVRQADGALRLDGSLSYEGLTYTVESVVPRPDIAILATDDTGELSPAFALAAEEEQEVPDPVVVKARSEPPDVDRYLDLPETLDPGIKGMARQLTANLATNYEKGLALESWFHSSAFRYTTDIEPGHGATDLAAWLLEPQSPNYRQGYCENFATAMAVMARTLGVPSRVVLGFTPGEPTAQENVVVVRDRNAHAWVELWIPAQGWVRFDPTPRSDSINPSTYGLAESELGFSLTSYLDVPDPETLDVAGSPLAPPQFADDEPLPVFSGGGATNPNPGKLTLPTWIAASAPFVALVLLLGGTVPTIKWWRRRRRMRRLEHGDIAAAWEDIVARLTDLGERPPHTATPRQVAMSVDNALVPLAVIYGRSIYGPPNTIEPHHIETAIESLDHTRTQLTSSHSYTRRVAAAYRPSSIIPERVKRTARRLRPGTNRTRQ